MINAQDAHGSGYRGEAWVGFFDSGAQNLHPVLHDNVWWGAYTDLVDHETNDLSQSDVIGHGTAVAQLVVGRAKGGFGGGVAPEGNLAIRRIIPDDPVEGNPFGQPSIESGLSMLELGLKASNGVLSRALNFSWDGNFVWQDQATTDRLARAFHSYVDTPWGVSPAYDGLVVFAAGDGGSSDPNQMAALPSLPGAASLEPNWITVAAVETAHPDRLASYSNACGVAMNYCMVAPGDVIVTGKEDTEDRISYWSLSSTQMASPQVLGAVSVVLDAFPYLTGAQVRQVLLGTATDLGDPGVDPVFGHGLLNVGKAVRGPAKFDWGDVHVQLPAGTVSRWWNGISGAGGLTVDSDGSHGARPELGLAGENTFAGGLHVTGGTAVSINGSMHSSVTVDPESYFYPWEVTLHGDLTSHGVVQINAPEFVDRETVLKGDFFNYGVFINLDYPHTTLEGNFVQGAEGAFWTILGTDPLRIDGSAQLDGGLFIYDVAEGYVARTNTEVLVAEEGITGEFAWHGYNSASFALLDATVGYGSDRVWLDVERVDVAAAASGLDGISGASMASAVRIEDAFERIDAQLLKMSPSSDIVIRDEFVRAAGNIQRVRTVSAFEATLDSLSGKAHAAASAMTFDSIDLNRRALASRFGELVVRPAISGAWTQALGGAGAGSFAGGQYRLDGWMLGNDYRLGGPGVAGFAFGQTRADSAVSGGPERGRDRQAHGQLYGGWLHGNGYALGQLGFGRYDRRIDRQLLLGSGRSAVQADYAGEFASASLEAGYRLGRGATSLTPYAGAEHARVVSDGFHEHGAGGFGLRTGAISSSRTQAIAGMRAGHVWRGLDLRGYAEWQHTLSADGLQIDASFVGVDA
ncbi:autotransporter domain-containing protein, partial [Luteimonas sp. SJ-92]|nr:autotransporter domain-containing protein [Luteimonas salinisoli]